MNLELWKVYDKKGNNLNLNTEAYLNMIFKSDVGKNAEGYAITDTSGYINRTFITNKGLNYDVNTKVSLDYTFNTSINPIDVSSIITYTDVSIFNPLPNNTKGINSVQIINNRSFLYPSVAYVGALFLEPISVGLVETEHLLFLQDSSFGLISPYDNINSTLIFQMVGDENQIQLFTVNDDSQEVIWTDQIIMDISTYKIGQGIQINIGFSSNDEGVYERRLIIYHKVGVNTYPLIEFVVNAQSIGEDQRFDSLLDNFGLYKPKTIPTLFKEADINESKPDWELLNYKAKHLILEHQKILPYIGTYKGLINAIKWLGYEDIQVKEWFRDVKSNKLLSLYVPYEASDRKKTIKYFSPEERQNLKKLNQLSLVYCITKETGEIDDFGTPITENCYEYNLDEVYVKLYALKKWLEKNIIGVNTRIHDLTGEGIYFERYGNYIYGTQNIGTNAIYKQSLTPIALSKSSQLISGDSSVMLSLKEFDKLTAEDLNCRFIDLARYGWDPSNGFFSADGYFDLSYQDPSTVFFGASALYPFQDLYDIQWKLQVSKQYGVITKDFIDNPLFIYNNDIIFYNVFDTSARFFDVSANVDVTISSGFLRDPSIDVWEDSISYTIYPETSNGVYTGKSIIESSMGYKQYAWGDFSLQNSIDLNPKLIYTYDNLYKVPLLIIEGYKWTDASGISHVLPKNYTLEILTGTISMENNELGIDNDIVNVKNYVNFVNSASTNFNQTINLNVEYTSSRMPIYNYDPSDASTLYYNPNTQLNLVDDNSTYKFKVNHIGDYNIEVYGWNGQNNVFYNFDRSGYNVWQKYPNIYSFVDTSCLNNICSSIFLSINDISTLLFSNKYPIFDKDMPIQGLSLQKDINDNYYINVPEISYFQPTPEKNSICKFYNLTEQITNIDGNKITINTNYQFFNINDSVNLVQFDKGKKSFIREISANIIGSLEPVYWIDNIPYQFSIDSSTEWYILNNTIRPVNNAINNVNNTLICDISTGDDNKHYRDSQLIALLITDLSTNYQWGAAYRVIDSSVSNNYGITHVLDGNLPDFVVNDPSKYSLQAKYAFSTYSSFQIDVSEAYYQDGNFKIYLNDIYYHQYYLDNTFTFLNTLFDHENVLTQWYDASDNISINIPYYGFNNALTLDISTFVILKSIYESSTYMLNQKNIWEIKNRDTNEILMKVNNFIVPYIYDESALYDITLQSYDSYGNLSEQTIEGLITIK